MSTIVEQYVERATSAYREELTSILDANEEVDGDPRLAGIRGAAASAAEQMWVSEVGPFLDTAGAAAMLGGVSKQAVSERVRGRRLLALRMGSEGRIFRYPLWQFDGAVLDHLPRILEAVGYRPHVAWQGGMVAAWLCAPDETLGGLRPRDLLAAGQDEEILARTADVRFELGSDERDAGLTL